MKKIALVTGGLQGIGGAITSYLLRDGFVVVANYKNPKDEVFVDLFKKKQGRDFVNLVPFKADATNAVEVSKMIAEIKKKFGILNAVINNAGINQKITFENSTENDFDRMIEGNLKSAITVTRFALPLLKKSKHSRIIFISSANAFIGSPLRAGYVVSKSGLLGLTNALALELAPRILVNTIVPGYINTRMFRRFTGDSIPKKIKKIPLRRIGKPEDVAGVVSFLCSDQALYITGQSIHVNGGLYFA